MRRMSSSVEVVEHKQVSLRQELAKAGLEALPDDVLVYSIDGPFFFGSVDSLERALSWSRPEPRYLALRLERVPFMDATGLKRLESTIDGLRARGVQVLLNGARVGVLRKLVRADIVRRDKPGIYFKDLSEALRYIASLRAAPADSPSP
jgi:SulP family sulfate permease